MRGLLPMPMAWSYPAWARLRHACQVWRPLAAQKSSPPVVPVGGPTLAICVGHQVLFEAGIEHGVRTEGCGIWPGLVEELHAARLPHMGWNTDPGSHQQPSYSRVSNPTASTSCTATEYARCPRLRSGASRGPNMTATGSWRQWRKVRSGPPSSTPKSQVTPELA